MNKTLSDKIETRDDELADYSPEYYNILVSDVKEALKELKDEMGNTTRGLKGEDLARFYRIIKQIFGDKLI